VQPTATGDGTAAEAALVRKLGQPALVMVSRSHGGWVAEVAAIGVVRKARTLVGLDRRIRTLLGTRAVDYQFDTGDRELDRLVAGIRAARATAQRFEERAQRLTEQALELPSGGTVRDLGVLLGISHQRVHQLLGRHASQLSTVEERV
jgi:hypothetical protein